MLCNQYNKRTLKLSQIKVSTLRRIAVEPDRERTKNFQKETIRKKLLMMLLLVAINIKISGWTAHLKPEKLLKRKRGSRGW